MQEKVSVLETLLDSGDLALLQQGYRNNWQQYLAALSGATNRLAHWDICVLTASNTHQAEAYEAQLQARREAGLLPEQTRFLVIPDPAGLRIGSGGATLHVLAELERQGAFLSQMGGEGSRVLIIHSGGDSRRLPHCSATGKLFARIPHELPDGRPSSLFDEFLVSLSGLPRQIPPGVLIASGDVLLLFDHLQLAFNRPGIIGVAAAAAAETGTHHGVYVTAEGRRQVKAFLHKPSLDVLQAEGALHDDGQVSIDTGLVWLDQESTRKYLLLAGRLGWALAQGVTINLYGDLLAPLAQNTDYQHYLADTSDGPITIPLAEARRVIWKVIRGMNFSVECLRPAAFIHFGSTREYLQVLQEGVGVLAACGWRSQASSWHPPVRYASLSQQEQTNAVMVNAYVQDVTRLSGCLLDSRLETRLDLGDGSLLANLTTARNTLVVRPGLVLDQLPLCASAGYVSRFFGAQDDPKHSVIEGGTFCNRPWGDWLAQAGVNWQELWPQADSPAQCTLWDAQLYPVCPTREESLELVLWLQEANTASPDVLEKWRTSQRLSLHESYLQADVPCLVREQGEVEDWVRARHFVNGIERERPASTLATLLGAPRDLPRRARLVADWLEASIDPWLPLRGYYTLAIAFRATLKPDVRWENRAFSALARLVRAHTAPAGRSGTCSRDWLPQASVHTAARIDLGGGWSDTPPYSLERGGKVLNAAIALRGELPIVVRATTLPEPVLVLESCDLEATLHPRLAGDLLDFANPADPFALHKAAMVFCGIVPSDTAPEAELADVLRPLGCGLHLATSTSIPRGSGLGTSSIVAGAILKCLARLRSQTLELPQLFDQVLCLEQMITTGGGWQDQVGGLMGGIKLITTQPGLPQMIQIEPVGITPTLRQALDERILLIYTGQNRLAKGLLRTIMGRFMARDPEAVAMLRDITQLAQAMHQALQAGDPDTCGELIAQHWEINKRMDPGCTNPFIDSLFDLWRPFLAGAKLAGAGGGGFALAIARDLESSLAMQRALLKRYPQSQVRVWPCRVVEQAIQ
ncbi:MAG: fucose pyrophosphorylase domain-containing protein [Anaerolineae bacterium]